MVLAYDLELWYRSQMGFGSVERKGEGVEEK